MQPVEFVGSARSQAARSRRWVWIAVLVTLAVSYVSTGFNGNSLMFWGMILGVLLVVDRFWMRKLGQGELIALLDEEGIQSPLLAGDQKRHAWSEVAGATVATVHQGRVLRLQLNSMRGRPERASFWNGKNPSQPQIPLDALSPQQQEQLLDLVLKHAAAAGAAGMAAPNELRQERLFKEQLEALAPVPWLTYSFVAINILVWLWMTALGANGVRADAEVLLDWGANSAHDVVANGEWWRLLTAAFLHGGAVHVAMNMVGLVSAGITVERLYGRAQYALIYLGAALVGSALSLHFSAQRMVSVGASGAVFGVAAAMLVGLYGHRKELPKGLVRRTVSGLGFFILYSLLQGFARQGIDNAAHVGGLVAGAVLAGVLPTRLDLQRFAAFFRPRAMTGLVLTAAAVGGLLLSAPPGVDQRQVFASVKLLQQGMRSLEAAYRGLQHDQDEAKNGRMTELQLDERARTVHARAFRTAVQDLQEVQLPAEDPRREFAADSLRAAQLLTEMLAMDSDIVDGKPVPARPERYAAAEKELMRVSARMQEQAERFKRTAGR